MDYETLNSCILCGSSKIRVFEEKHFLFRCADCGLVFDNPRPTLSSIAAYYSKHDKYDPWLERQELLEEIWHSLLNRIMRLKSGGDLLDIGAGIGQFLSLAQNKYTCRGTELSSEGIHLAKEKFGITLRQGEVEDIDFKGQQFDIITMHQVLEHVPFPGQTIMRCRELLKPDGVLYIGVPNEAPYSLRMLLPGLFSALGAESFKSFSRKGHRKIDLEVMNEIHLSHFSEKTLTSFLRSSGFSQVQTGIDFIDPYMLKTGLLKVFRQLACTTARVLKAGAGINIYNCFWIAARKQS